MNDVVSASASRMRSLAKEIKECSAAILSSEPGIKSGIDGWEATVDTRALRELANWLKDEAAPMLDRADWAQTALNQPGMGTTPNRPEDWRDIPWTITPEMQRQEGYADSARLARLMQSKDSGVRDQAAREAAWAMEAHADDPKWLEAFFTTGGAVVLSSLPRHLLARDGMTLSGGSQQALHWYSLGIARASKLQEQGKITLPGAIWYPIYNPVGGDMWSSGMLVAQGPKGDQYGAKFLAGLAAAALDWKDKHGPMRPPYSAPAIIGTSFVPGGYIQNDGAWWKNLGIDVGYNDSNQGDAARGIARIRANDPLSFILGRTGENPDASRALLAGPRGPEHAMQLVDVHWQTPGPDPQDDSGPAASVIRAATFDRKGRSEESARAALNLIKAGNEMARQSRSSSDREQYPRLPSDLAKSLSFVATLYSDDLGISSGVPKAATQGLTADGGVSHLITNAAVVNGFLHALMTDPEASGALEGALRVQMAAVVQWESTHGANTNAIEHQGRLLGMLNLAANDIKFDVAEAKDKANARNKIYFDSVTGIVSGVPGLPNAQTMLLVTATGIAASNGDVWFSDGNADKVTDESQADTYKKLQEMRVEIAQGLLRGGKLPPPIGRSFYRDNVFVVSTVQDEVEFERWWGTLGDDYTKYESRAQEGFNEVNNANTANDHKFDCEED